jgi:hypothetical protein
MSASNTIHKTAVFVAITLKLVCHDKTEGHFQMCRVLGVLAPIFLSVHLGASLAAFGMFIIPLNDGNPIFLRRLQLVCEYIGINAILHG